MIIVINNVEIEMIPPYLLKRLLFEMRDAM